MSSDNISPPTGNDVKRLTALERENAQLREIVERIKKERIEYLQNVSHQLVAPLNAIKWHIENITSNRVGVDRAKKVLRSIYSQSTIAVHLAKNFALMSNLDADHSLAALREPLQEVNLFALFVNLADDFQPLGWDKGLKISVVNGDLEKAPKVLAIKPLLSQVFSNIIENAVKYSKRDTEVVIDGSYDCASESVRVTIASHGIPISKDDIAKIFDRGHRSVEAKNLYPAGTGFGLYIAKRVVEIHEGRITVRTDTAGRAIFEVVLSVRGLEGKTRQRDAKDRTINRR